MDRLAETWAAKAAEWRRVRDVVAQAGWPVYAPEGDVEGAEWAREREERRAAVLKEAAAAEVRRREAADELRTEVWLPAAPGRLIRAAAARAGLRPDEVLAQVAQRVTVSEDGTISVPPFTPNV
ncbi:hypothetical protein [Streptomyces kronopolitis]|uniref:hypothetical protein n=1 Tax=Streptomyces kronopolitis TaxID=1612435 RepID=UPI003D96F756